MSSMENITIDLLSDTHNRHSHCKCQGGNILLHAGDTTGRGDIREIVNFLDWYSEQDYDHLILVPGNHDFGFESNPKEMKELCENRGIILLNDSGITIEGIKIWGSPVQPWFHDWAFNRNRGPDIKKHWDLIPRDTELLITHGPPYGILDQVAYGMDKNVGCMDLLNMINESQVKLHVFGHIHEARGIKYQGKKAFVNASYLDRSYYPQAKAPMRAIREVDDGEAIYTVAE